MKNVGEFINEALIKAGVAPDNEYLKKILTNAELTKETIPDELVSQFNNSLITINDAKTNFDLKSHFYGAALTPVEKELKNLMLAYELPDEDINELEGIKSTYSKIPALKAKLDIAIQKKAAAEGGDKNKHAQEIVRLNAELAAATKKEQERIDQIRSDYENKMLDMHVSNHLARYNYTEALPSDVALMTAKNLFNQVSSTKKAKVKLVNDNLELVNADDESLPYMEANQVVAFKSFIDKIVADNKLLKTATPPPAAPPATGGGGGNKGLPANTMSILDRQAEQLKNQKTV